MQNAELWYGLRPCFLFIFEENTSILHFAFCILHSAFERQLVKLQFIFQKIKMGAFMQRAHLGFLLYNSCPLGDEQAGNQPNQLIQQNIGGG